MPSEVRYFVYTYVLKKRHSGACEVHTSVTPDVDKIVVIELFFRNNLMFFVGTYVKNINAHYIDEGTSVYV